MCASFYGRKLSRRLLDIRSRRRLGCCLHPIATTRNLCGTLPVCSPHMGMHVNCTGVPAPPGIKRCRQTQLLLSQSIWVNSNRKQYPCLEAGHRRGKPGCESGYICKAVSLMHGSASSNGMAPILPVISLVSLSAPS